MRRRSRWYGAKQGRQRVEVLEQGRCGPDRDRPRRSRPTARPAPPCSPVSGRDRIELVLVDDLDQLSVEVVAPGVIAAPDAVLGESSRSRRRGECRGADRCCGRRGWSRGPTERPGSTGRRSGTRRTSPTSAISSSRQATCQTRDHRRSNSSSGKLGAGVAGSGNGVVLTDQHALEIHVVDLLYAQDSVPRTIGTIARNARGSRSRAWPRRRWTSGARLYTSALGGDRGADCAKRRPAPS